MTTINLKGGLGNQMFQYAYGRNLAIKTGKDLILNIYDLENPKSEDTKRAFELDQYNIIAKIDSSKPKQNFFKKIIQKINSAFFYYQSEKYFQEITPQILEEFTLKNPLSQNTEKILEQIKNNSNSVSIHIRRGDYVNNSKTNKYHGTCSLEYYEKAIDFIKEKISPPQKITFYIFTDDPKWAKENLKLENMFFVSDANLPDYEEMFLMSQCKHNIIANSSFSWWGAWLNQNPNKIVVAPERWVKKKPNPHKNIIPKSWTKI